jgi:hypothetical protein
MAGRPVHVGKRCDALEFRAQVAAPLEVHAEWR